MLTVDQIIERAGGGAAVALACAVERAALRKWRQFGKVPPRHHLTLMRLSRGALGPDDLDGGEAGAHGPELMVDAPELVTSRTIPAERQRGVSAEDAA